MVEKLKPCPTCGSGDIAWCNISHRPYCRECNCWGSVNFGTDEEAIVAWNRRTEETPVFNS
jgi:hypothetical protein